MPATGDIFIDQTREEMVETILPRVIIRHEVISTQMAKSPPGLLFLDPDVETSAEDFARDWRSLEAMKPQLVAIYNTNLPGERSSIR